MRSETTILIDHTRTSQTIGAPELWWHNGAMSNTDLRPPTEASLREAALAHLARYASTRLGLARVLSRRIDKWAIRARRSGDRETIAAQIAAAKAMIEPIVAKLSTAGAVDDLTFAASRSLSLTRSGRSGRAVQANLVAKGVPAEIAREATKPDPAREFGACLVAARKRRLGPFSTKSDPDTARKEMATLARAGFAERIAREIFALTPDEAEARLIAWRRDGETWE